MVADTVLLTVQQVADRLAVQPITVRRWLARGELKGVRFGRLWRISEQEVERFIREHQYEGDKRWTNHRANNRKSS
jgi:excisionase family DNA binding protein